MPLRGEDPLLTIAEFAIALAGFTSVVVVFNRRDGAWAPIDRFRIQSALMASFGAGAFALLPSCFHLLGVPEPEIWQVSSGLLFVYVTGHGYISTVGSLRLDSGDQRLLAGGRPIFSALCLVSMALQAVNAIGVGVVPQPGLFLLGLLLLLVLATFSFVRTVFIRPG